MIGPQTCPICNKPLSLDATSESTFIPFCSKRCKDIDFSRWSAGKYSIVEPLDPSKLSEEELDSLGMGEGELE